MENFYTVYIVYYWWVFPLAWRLFNGRSQYENQQFLIMQGSLSLVQAANMPAMYVPYICIYIPIYMYPIYPLNQYGTPTKDLSSSTAQVAHRALTSGRSLLAYFGSSGIHCATVDCLAECHICQKVVIRSVHTRKTLNQSD